MSTLCNSKKDLSAEMIEFWTSQSTEGEWWMGSETDNGWLEVTKGLMRARRSGWPKTKDRWEGYKTYLHHFNYQLHTFLQFIIPVAVDWGHDIFVLISNERLWRNRFWWSVKYLLFISPIHFLNCSTVLYCTWAMLSDESDSQVGGVDDVEKPMWWDVLIAQSLSFSWWESLQS